MLRAILTSVRGIARSGSDANWIVARTTTLNPTKPAIALQFPRITWKRGSLLQVTAVRLFNLSRRSFLSTPRSLANTLNRNRSGRGKNKHTDVVLYFASGIIFMVGVSYAAVPLYRMFCQATGIGGDPKLGHKIDNIATMKPIRERRITVAFNADRHSAMRWNFKPSQQKVTVVPGETALAFYTAKNPTDEPIVGVATYNVVPFQAGPYFNKIQCFCFEEQWLNPHEEVDMPVFFYIDPEFDDDPALAVVDEIVLSYTFFKAEEGMTLPVPGFMNSTFKGTNENASAAV